VPRFAANISFLFTELPFLECPAAAAHAGFGAVECHYPYDTPPERLQTALSAAGIPMLGINTNNYAGPARDAGIAAVPGREAESSARVEQAIAYAPAIGSTSVHITAGNALPGSTAARSAFIETLRNASERAAGLTFLIEPLNRRENPDYFLRSIDQAMELLEAVDRANVRLMFDIYHAQINEGDILTRFAASRTRIGHVQIAAVPGRGEPDQGELNYAHIVARLDELGYAGWIGAEYRPRTTTAAGLGRLRAYLER